MNSEIGTKQATEQSGTLFKNIRIFDGINESLQVGVSILVEGNRIKQISREKISVPVGFSEIDGKGHILMPGIINSHYHMFGALPTKIFW